MPTKYNASSMRRSLADALFMFSLDVVRLVVNYTVCAPCEHRAQPKFLFAFTLPNLHETASASAQGLASALAPAPAQAQASLSTLLATVSVQRDSEPICLAMAPDGKLWVAGSTRGCVFSSSGQWLFELANLLAPRGIAFDHQARALIADMQGATIQMYSVTNGSWLGRFDISSGASTSTNTNIGDSSSQIIFDRPWGVAVNRHGRIFVTDLVKNRIRVFDKDANLVAKIGSRKRLRSRFNYPGDLVCDHAGHMVYVGDRANDRIQVFNEQGRCCRTLQSVVGPKAIQAEQGPRGLAFDADDNLFVCDYGGHQVLVMRADGMLVTAFGQSGKGDGQFDRPSGVCIARDGRIYVADRHRIQVFGFCNSSV